MHVNDSKRSRSFGAALLLVAALAIPQAGQAASVACNTLTPDVSGLVTPNIGCEALTSAENDSASAVSGMFGIASWMELVRIESDPFVGGSSGGLTVTGDAEGGDWSIAQSIFDAYSSVMLVFKGGTHALPEPVVGFLLETSPGTYTSTFYDQKKSGEFKIKDISHVTLYVSNLAPVPLPAAGLLLLGALGGLGLMRRRKRPG